MPVKFPRVDSADESGIVAVGGNLNLETLITAYLEGIFPWPISDDLPLTWFAPDPRGIIIFKNFHISKSLRKFINKTKMTVVFNKDFEKVIKLCGQTRQSEKDGTWINQDIIAGYVDLFRHNLAYCASVYENNELVGGIYGVCIGEIISGESMFFTKTNASKFAMVKLIEKLQSKGISWIDTQMVTPVVQNFGGTEVTRKKFMQLLSKLNTNRTRFEIFGS